MMEHLGYGSFSEYCMANLGIKLVVCSVLNLVDPIGKHPIYVHEFPLMEQNKGVLLQNVLQASETWNTIIFSCNENIIQTPKFFLKTFFWLIAP